jgi:2-keto-4-pentenoate hydratase
MNIKKAANILYDSRIKLKNLIKLPIDCEPKNKEEAYIIQESLSKLYISNNKNITIIGKKVGCTNKEAQEQINITEPFYGNIFSFYSSKTNCCLNRKDFFKPLIEPEFSFKIKDELDISKAPYSTDDIIKSISYIIPSIEIVESRFQNWTQVGINNLIADNGANAYWIYGNKNENLNNFDLYNHKVSLFINDQLISEGNSNKVLGNPLNSLKWLINTLAHQGKKLPKNSYVSTGSCTPAISIKENDNIRADFGTLGEVVFTII